MSNEILFIIGSIIVLITGILLINIIIRQTRINTNIARKFLHVTAGMLSSIALFVIKNINVLITTSIIILFFLIVLSYFNKNGKYYFKITMGMIYFTLSYIVLLIFYGDVYREIIAISMLIMSFSDSIAAIFGSYLSTSYYNLSGEKKSILGSVTFFISTFFILIIAPVYTQIFYVLTFNLHYNLIIAFILSLQLTLIEGLSSKGTDNIFVPIYSSLFLFFIINPVNTIVIENYLIGMVLSLIVVLLSIKVRFLTISGGVATFLLANTIFGFGGLKWTIPILTFFILSSLLSKIKTRNKESAETYYDKTGVRDYKQVFANGGVAGVFVVLNSINPNELYFLMYVVFLATVCSDTWSTEIGTLFNSNTYNIINLKQVIQGVSGGISFIGTFGGILGAIIIILVSISFTSFSFYFFFLIILISSFLGNITDSVMGATLQAGFNCTVCGKNTERKVHCGKQSNHTKGIIYITNDIVNFCAGLFSVFISIIIYYLIFI